MEPSQQNYSNESNTNNDKRKHPDNDYNNNNINNNNNNNINNNNRDTFPSHGSPSSPPYKKRRPNHSPVIPYVLLLGYVGTRYHGLQVSPGVTTIESVVIDALRSSQMIGPHASHKTIQLKRACRTDKGVHAACNVLSIRIPGPPTSRPVSTAALKETSTTTTTTITSTSSSITDINRALPADIHVLDLQPVHPWFSAKNHCKSRVYRYILPTFTCAPKYPPPPNETFEFQQHDLQRLNDILARFEGTHAYHNFTDPSRTSPGDPHASRTLRYVRAEGDCFAIDGSSLSWISVTFHGDSFIMHQIRKMIGFAIACLRGITTVDRLDRAWDRNIRMKVPLAPGCGLYLHRTEYPTYNRNAGTRIIDQDRVSDHVETFISQQILPDVSRHAIDYGEFLSDLDRKSNTYFIEKPVSRT